MGPSPRSRNPTAHDHALPPRSPYAGANLYSYCTTVNYHRPAGSMPATASSSTTQASGGTRNSSHARITPGVANIVQGLKDCLYMSNIDALQDWGGTCRYGTCNSRALGSLRSAPGNWCPATPGGAPRSRRRCASDPRRGRRPCAASLFPCYEPPSSLRTQSPRRIPSSPASQRIPRGSAGLKSISPRARS
jgi:hypothetical protein